METNFFSRIMQSSDRFSVKQSKYLKGQVLTDVHGAFGSSSEMTGLSKFNHPNTRLEVSCAVIGFMLHRFTEVQLSVHKMATVNRQHVLHCLNWTVWLREHTNIETKTVYTHTLVLISSSDKSNTVFFYKNIKMSLAQCTGSFKTVAPNDLSCDLRGFCWVCSTLFFKRRECSVYKLQKRENRTLLSVETWKQEWI